MYSYDETTLLRLKLGRWRSDDAVDRIRQDRRSFGKRIRRFTLSVGWKHFLSLARSYKQASERHLR